MSCIQITYIVIIYLRSDLGPAHTGSSELLTSKFYHSFLLVSTRERGCPLQVGTAHQKNLTWSEEFPRT